MSSRDFDCCQTCRGCGKTWCAHRVISPGEKDGLCVNCWATEDDGSAA